MKAVNDVKLNYLIGKIKSWISETKTWATETFCAKSHTHDVETDVTGILAPEHGGTGVESIEALTELLNVPTSAQSSMNFAYKYYEGEGRHGKDNPVTIPLDFCPKLMIICRDASSAINVIPFTYYPADEDQPERSTFYVEVVPYATKHIYGGIRGSYEDGVLSWYFSDIVSQYTIEKVDLETGYIQTESKTIPTNDEILRTQFQQDEEGTFYNCYIFG